MTVAILSENIYKAYINRHWDIKLIKFPFKKINFCANI
jgi:hypothetical protein